MSGMHYAPTFSVNIYVGLKTGYAGEAQHPAKAIAICQHYCNEVGFGLTVTPTIFVYKGGFEPGVIVGLINYPRFPKQPDEIIQHAITLGGTLRHQLAQERISIVTPEQTIMLGDT